MSTKTNTGMTLFVSGKEIHVNSMTEFHRVVNLNAVFEIDAKIAELQAKRKSALEGLYDSLGTGKHVVPGVGTVTFSDNNVYDDKAIMSALKPGQQRLVTKRVLDRAKVKAQYPAVYEAAKSYRGYKASVSPSA